MTTTAVVARGVADEALRDRLRAVHCYAVTPFRDEDLSLDEPALAANLEWLIEHGVQVIAVGGGTGEIDALSVRELEAVARVATQAVRHRALVIATVPGDLGAARELLPHYEQLGVEVVLGIPPLIRGHIPSDLEGVAEYYEAVAAATRLPLMPYNTQRWPAELFERLARIPSIVGVKDPCEDDLPMFRAIQRLGSRFIWIGNKRHDPGVVHLRYQMGMEGFTSGMANFLPEPELRMHEAAVRRDWDEVIRLQALAADLERARDASDDAAMVKACMDMVGLRGGRVRPPRRDVPDVVRARLASAVEALADAMER